MSKASFCAVRRKTELLIKVQLLWVTHFRVQAEQNQGFNKKCRGLPSSLIMSGVGWNVCVLWCLWLCCEVWLAEDLGWTQLLADAG